MATPTPTPTAPPTAAPTPDLIPGATLLPATDPRLVNAAMLQAATRQQLAVLGDAFTCTDAGFVSYRRSDKDPAVTDQWYVASQLGSDHTRDTSAQAWVQHLHTALADSLKSS
jgi:hypothetical protein